MIVRLKEEKQIGNVVMVPYDSGRLLSVIEGSCACDRFLVGRFCSMDGLMN